MPTTASQTRHAVTAVIVAHDGAEMLPALVRALAAQTHLPERTLGVDTGSEDQSAALLTHVLGRDFVLSMPRETGFGEAVATALRHRPAPRRDSAPRRVEWVWLLHDDCEPAPHALEQLIKAASRDRSVVVLGPKVIDAADRRTLRETGIAIDRGGRRITGIEPGEIDQGQHDGTRPVLAVGSAGMLIRRDVWDQLGGFDTQFGLFRDDLDFCWRVHGAGYRVLVVTDALLYHRELSARRRRARRAEAPRLRLLDRRNALYTLAVNLPLLRMLAVLAGCVAGSLLRTAWFLLTKQEDQAAAHGYSVAWLFLHPLRIWNGRRRRKSGRAAAYAAVRSLIPPGRTLARIGEDIAGLVSSGPPPVTGGRHQAVSLGEEEDDQFTDQHSLARRIIGHPGVRLAVALTIVALIAERRLLGTSPLGGGALVPAWGGAFRLWSEYLAGFHPVGLGSAASTPPYVAVVAALGTVLGGQAWLAVDAALLGCVPLAGITAYLAARRLTGSGPARLLLAASYAMAPVAIGAVATGRLGTAVAFAAAPLIALSAGRMLTSGPRAARRAAWGTGLLVALAAAFSPLVWLIATAGTVVAVVARRRLWPLSRIDAAIVVLTPFVVLFPWSLHLLASPSALLAEAGVPAAGAGSSLPAQDLLMLSPGGPGLPPAWVTAGLALAVAAAFAPRRRRLTVGTGWAVAALGYLTAVIVSRSAAPAGPGTALAVAALGLLIAAAPAAERLAGLAWRPADGRTRAALAAAALAAAATAPVAAAVFWVADGVRGPVTPVTQPVLPAYVAASSAGSAQYRTLVLRPGSSGVAFSVLRSRDESLGEPELAGYGPAETALSSQVAALTAADSADSGDPGLGLGSFGIHWVLLPGPVSQALAQRLDAASGLVPVSSSPAYDLWQVAGTAARARVIGPDGTVTAVSSQSGARVPASGGELVLAEPYGGWTVRVNGVALRPLPAPVDGWAQGFALPKGGGTVGISRDGIARPASLLLELVALLVIGVLAVPGRRGDPEEEAAAIAAARAAQQEQRAARAARTRELAVQAAIATMESGLAHRVVPGIVAGFPSGRGSRAVPPPVSPGEPLALPAAPARSPMPALPPAPAAGQMPPAEPETAPFAGFAPAPFAEPAPPQEEEPPLIPGLEPPEPQESPVLRLQQSLTARSASSGPRPERTRSSGRGAHRASRHAKPRGRRGGRDGE